MSDAERSPSARALDALVAEAKEYLDVRAPGETEVSTSKHVMPADVADIDWARLESRVMARLPTASLEKGRTGRREREPYTASGASSDTALRFGAVVLAVAAAVALFVRRDRDVPLLDAPPVSSESLSASSLRAMPPGSQVRVGGTVATPGYVVRSRDVIEVQTGRAVFERAREVSWLLEQDAPAGHADGREDVARHEPAARARVESTSGPLVLGLEHGAIEAQVTPVPSGEAFAIDVRTDRSVVRVAVHGTHLRVGRSGDRVVIDLTEGVVSIGNPPRTGATYGALVTAPAHVELDATDLETLRIDHTPTSVRAASSFATPPSPVSNHDPTAVTGTMASGPRLPSSPAPLSSTTANLKGVVPRPSDVAPITKAEASSPPLAPRDAISTAIRDCAVAQTRTGSVRVTVSSELELRVSSVGTVESANFSPPLLPEIQSCAAKVIYKTKLDETGNVKIPIEFSY